MLTKFQQELFDTAYDLIEAGNVFMNAKGSEAVDDAACKMFACRNKFRELVEKAVDTNQVDALIQNAVYDATVANE